MRDSRARVGKGFLHLLPKPGVVDFRVGRQARWQGAFPGDTCEQNADGIGNGQAHVGELFRRLGLQVVVHADMQHRRSCGHRSISLVVSRQYVSQLRYEQTIRRIELPAHSSCVPSTSENPADRKSTRLNSSPSCASRMPSSACKKKPTLTSTTY